jgi:hypothetical protein
VREIPEVLKPRRIQIASVDGSQSSHKDVVETKTVN